MTKVISFALIAVVLTTACSSLNPRFDRPAVIVTPSEQSRPFLQHAIANLLRGATVEIANNLLTETSSFTVHRTLIGSRDLGAVDNFQLVINRGRCYLIHLNTQNRELLAEIECVEISSN